MLQHPGVLSPLHLTFTLRQALAKIIKVCRMQNAVIQTQFIVETLSQETALFWGGGDGRTGKTFPKKQNPRQPLCVTRLTLVYVAFCDESNFLSRNFFAHSYWFFFSNKKEEIGSLGLTCTSIVFKIDNQQELTVQHTEFCSVFFNNCEMSMKSY